MPAAKAKPKPAAKKDEGEKKSDGRGRRIETPASATFGVDDKRAQYARLVVFNFGVKEGLIPKSKDVNSATNAEIEKAAKALNGGTFIDGDGEWSDDNKVHKAGSGGLSLISELSKAGATDEKVAERGLTKAYSAEVRPFIRRMAFSDNFGRRQKERTEEEKQAMRERLAAGRAKAAANKGKASTKKSTAKK